jgi:hypothetical protein
MDVSLDLVAGGFLKSHFSACSSAEFNKNLFHGKYQNPIYVSFLFLEKYLWAIYELTFVYCQNNLEIMALLNSTFLVLLQRFLMYFFQIIALRALRMWKFILFTSLPTQATSSLTAGTQTQAKRILEVFGTDTCKFCIFSSQQLYIGIQCDACFECCLTVPAHVHIIISCHSNHFNNAVLCYGFLFSLLIGFSSFPCLCNADAFWIHDLDPTYFVTLFHWFILDPELVHVVPSSCLISL